MNINISNIYGQITSFVKGLSKKSKILITSGIVGVLLLSIVLTIVLNNRPYELLFGGLTSEEASQIMGKLQEYGVAYKYQEDGKILVPKKDEPQLKAKLVSEGYPKSGFTYDVFKENINMMSTDFEKESYKLFELQSRMEATIRLFDGVKDATVNIALPEQSKYILSSKAEQSAVASVVVVMENGGSPSIEQAIGIQKLVSGGIQGMQAKDISVIDGNGQEVVVSEQTTQMGLTRLKLEIQKEVESATRAKVLHMLEPIFGADKVRVSVTSVMDLDKKIKEIINYEPEGQTGKGVISKEETNKEMTTNGKITGGTPGTNTNSDIPIYPGVTTDGDEIYIKDDQSMDYLVSQVKEQIQSEAGEIKDLTVTVVIDSEYIDSQKIESLEALVATTAGISSDVAAEKVEIFNMSFPKGEVTTPIEPSDIFNLPLWVIIAIGVASLILTIIIIVLIAKLKRRKNDLYAFEEEPEDEFIESLKELEKVTISKENQLKDQISDFANTNPEIAAQMIKSWLKGDNANE